MNDPGHFFLDYSSQQYHCRKFRADKRHFAPSHLVAILITDDGAARSINSKLNASHSMQDNFIAL
jgi:hypothetical protein